MPMTWNAKLRKIIEDGLGEGLKPKAIAEKHGLRVEVIYTYIHRHGLAYGYKGSEMRKKKENKKENTPASKREIHCCRCGYAPEHRNCGKCWYYYIYNGFVRRD